MIHVLLKGGLGNVMFQIAAGYSHAIKLKTSLKVVKPALHFSHGDVYTKYKNNILAQIEFINVSNYLLYKEPFFHYTRLPLHSPITLDGYFQSEKYFVDYRDDILNLFDGIEETPGRILVITSNRYDELDPALRRPGRINITHKLGNASHNTISEIYSLLFNQNINETELLKIKEDLYSPAELVGFYVLYKESTSYMTRLLLNEKNKL